MKPKTYVSWNLPQYVLNYVGRPRTLIRTNITEWVLDGPDNRVSVQANTATEARTKIREAVATTLGIQDHRIERHKT